MTPDDVTYTVDDRYFESALPHHNALIVVSDDPDELQYVCAVRSTTTVAEGLVTLSWFAQLLARVAEYGFPRAAEMDGWQKRSDGRWQLWGRLVELPSLD